MTEKRSSPGPTARSEAREISLAKTERDLFITRATDGPPDYWLRIGSYRETRFHSPPAGIPTLRVVIVGDAEVTHTFNRDGSAVHPPGFGWIEIGPAGASTVWARPALSRIDVTSEKAPDTPIEVVRIDGVAIRSRYRKRREFLILAEAVGSMPASIRAFVEEVWVDSKATWVIVVALTADTPDGVARDVANHFDVNLASINGGHNGITVEDEYRETFWRAP